ncbi:hypothetical protein MNEG_14835 [Monoraphidium neglectum]|uniref:Uncharacterized protein n=1 Tax=Monoraphidium neglectum TaxID=145388 RepID=A0A0D2KAZ9_9CHLO|nr:hypothetical protein MNEG_14835 [Monoraphidium neglectum]KIY93128.1 hypothetical protein MNEG_14835 [Monoraphidium neglectum]|eukprot:XP_013892148.1 hypothetical protein MNEG_14835 [Monoraphidium neglectum]
MVHTARLPPPTPIPFCFIRVCSSVQAIIATATPKVLGDYVVFIAGYQDAANSSLGVGLLTLQFAPGQPASQPPAVLVQGVAASRPAYYTNTFGATFALQLLPGATAVMLVTNGSAYGTALQASVWDVTSGSTAPRSVVANDGFQGSAPSISEAPSPRIQILTNKSTIRTFSVTPAGDTALLSDTAISDLDQKSTLLSFGTSVVLAPAPSRRQMLLIISTTIPAYAKAAPNGAGVLAAYPMGPDGGVAPPPAGGGNAAGAFCVLAPFAAYASPGAAYRLQGGSLTVQFSQELNATNATIAGFTLRQ